MNDRQTDAIARVEVENPRRRGTAFHVGGPYVMTAYHVVAYRERYKKEGGEPRSHVFPGPIMLHFIFCEPPFQTKANVHENYMDPVNDWALLKCDDQPLSKPLPLSKQFGKKESWDGTGFPALNPEDGVPHDGHIVDPAALYEGARSIALYCNQAGGGPGEPIEGLSGAPCLVDGAVIGLIKSTYLKEGHAVGSTLYACPISPILERCGDLLPPPHPYRGLPGIPRKEFRTWLETYAANLDEEFEKLLSHDKQLGPGEATKYYLDVLVRERSESGVSPEAVPLSMLLEKTQKPVVVLGGGGTGKTGMLRKLACDLAQLALAKGDTPLPIFLSLKFFDPRGGNFKGLLESAPHKDLLPRDKLNTMWHQESRPCIFFLDGFNEVRNDFQGDCCLALQQFSQQKTHSFVITSRPEPQVDELLKQLGECCVAEVVKLEPAQIKEFLAAYGAEELYDRMSEKLKALAENPFLLWAIAQSCTSLESPDLPGSIGQLYQNLIDHYIFGVREQDKPEPSRPTQYNYELVKKPILARLAMEMCQRGDTRQPENDLFLDYIFEHLDEIQRGQKGKRPLKPFIFMPKEIDATTFLDEIAENGILHRNRGGLEFMHDSVRDYFTAVEMAGFKSPKEVLDFIPRLVWRFIDPSYFELPLEEPPFPAVIMLSGLLADSSDLVRSLAGHHPLLAAHCFGEARSIKPEVGTEMVEQWLDLLDRGHRRYRWVGCQCLGAARVDSRDIAERLKELIVSDREKRVRQAAMKALIGLNYPDLIKSLVKDALNATPAGDHEDILGETFFDLRSEVAVRELFAVWRNPEESQLHRNRAARLLVSMERRFVHRVLQNLHEEATRCRDDGLATSVNKAMEALDSGKWKPIGDSIGRIINVMHWAADKTRKDSQSLSLCRQSMANYSVAQLTKALRESDAMRRAAAASVLGERQALSVPELLDALAHEKDYGVRRALLEALERLEQPEELLHQWQTRMLDPQRNFLFKVELSMEEDLQAGELSERWHQEFAGRHLAVPPHAEVSATEGGWVIHKDGVIPYYFIKAGPDGLEVYDALKERLIPVAKVIGTPATPTLQEISNQADYPTRFAVARALGWIDSEEAQRLLAKLLLKLSHDHAMKAIRPLVKSRSRIVIFDLVFLLNRLGREETFAVFDDREVDDLRQRIRTIIQDLKSLNWDEMIEWAEHFLGSDKAVDRFKATVCLGFLYETDREGEELLEQALADPKSRIRCEAVAGLAHSKTESNEQALLSLCLEDPDLKVRQTAGDVLRRFPGDRAFQVLIQALEDQDAEKRVRAAEALRLMQEDSAIPFLLKAFETGPDRLRAAAGWALTNLGYEIKDVLIEAMIPVARENPDIHTREMAYEVIRNSPTVREKFNQPIYEALINEQFEKLIDFIGRDQPFLPNHSLLYYARGLARSKLQMMPEQALEDLDRAVELSPKHPYAHWSRAQVLGQLDRWVEALAAARQAVVDDRGVAVFYDVLGWCAYRTSNFKESIQASRQALDLDPKLINAAFNLGLALLADGEWEEAERAYQRGIDILREREDEYARLVFDSAVQDLEDLTKARPECAGPASLAKNLLEQARGERIGSSS